MAADSPAVLWHRRVDKGQIFYEINREHPLLLQLRDELSTELSSELETLLRGVERAFPVDAVFSDTSTDPKAVAQASMPTDQLADLVRLTVQALAGQGAALENIKRDLSSVEPFRSGWKSAEPLITSEYNRQVTSDV